MFEAICQPHTWKVTGLNVGSRITQRQVQLVFLQSLLYYHFVKKNILTRVWSAQHPKLVEIYYKFQLNLWLKVGRDELLKAKI